MDIGKHHITLTDLKYDRESLVNLYRSFHQSFAIEYNEWFAKFKFGIPFSKRVAGLKTLWTYDIANKYLIDYPEVQEIMNKIRWPEHKPTITDVHFMIYTPGWEFKTHTDKNLEYNIMIPVILDNDSQKLQFWVGEDCDKDTTKELDYEITYSSEYATLFNGKVLHSASANTGERVVLRIKVDGETYYDVVERIKNNNFLVM